MAFYVRYAPVVRHPHTAAPGQFGAGQELRDFPSEDAALAYACRLVSTNPAILEVGSYAGDTPFRKYSGDELRRVCEKRQGH